MSTGLILKLESRERPAAQVSFAREYEETLHDVRSILTDLCEKLAEAPRIRFVISFLGESWQTDVGTDLPVVLEQLPDLKVGGTKPFVLDLYEQGLERSLHFVPLGEVIEVYCQSRRREWNPPAGVARLSRGQVRSTLLELLEQFAEMAGAIGPTLVQHPWFVDWHGRATRAISEP